MDFVALIDKYRSNDLRDLHMLLFKEKTNDSEIKNNLKHFGGFKEKEFDANFDYAITNFDSEELIQICKQLEIMPSENNLEDAKSIVQKLTKKTQTHKAERMKQSLSSMMQDSTSTSSQAMDFTTFQDSNSNSQDLHAVEHQESSQINKEADQTLRQQSIIVHDLKKRLIDFEEKQLDLDEASSEFAIVSKRIIILQKRIKLEEERRLEILEENKLHPTINHNSNSNLQPNYNKDLHTLLLKTPQNLKLNDFNGSSCLDWHYFMLQYSTSTCKYQLSKEDNLIRLNDHVKGDARNKVDLLLKSSHDPSAIINILNIHYGGKDRVVKEIIKRANGIKKVTSLEYFKEFNCTLQNISSVLLQIDDSLLDLSRLQSILLEKLPDHFISQWANYLISNNLKLKTTPFKTFTDWINHMSEIVSEVAFNTTIKNIDYEHEQSNSGATSKRDSREEEKTTDQRLKTNSYKMCKLCKKEDHPLYKCPNFKALDNSKRFSTAKRMNFCIYCLNKHYGFCRKRKLCTINNCGKYHHELLHRDEKEDVIACIKTRSTVLLKMLPVKLKVDDKITKVLAFLDDGSTLSLIDKSIANEIGLKGVHEPISFQWTGDIHREDESSKNLSLEISGEHSDYFFKIDNVHTVDNLQLPRQRMNIEQLLKSYPELTNMNISKSYEGTPVILLGQRHAQLITNRQTIEIPNEGPLVSKTKLGWAVHGPVNISGKQIDSFVCYLSNDDSLEDIITKQFKLENFDLFQKKEEIEEATIIEKMYKTIKKCDNQYEIGLPWKENVSQLPNSLPMAKQRLIYLEKKLLKDKVLQDSYQSQIDKLLAKQYARKIKFSDLKERSRFWILPHFPVFNPKKPHKPARIVFDAAAKVEKSSLNDFLNTGPDWLCSIIGILIRFRQKKIAFTGDICEMFNRVNIVDNDTFAQCFLWRDLNINKPIEIYQMKAMLFGLNCAPFIAQFVKNYNAEQHKEEFPEAFKAITKNHYVDDFVDCKDDISEAATLINDVIQVHKRGGFQIRSFISNNFQLMKSIPKELVSDDMFKDISENIQKVLGLFWDIKSDRFCFLFKFHKTNSKILSGEKLPNKKEVLQMLMTIYDPLGFLSPLTIKAKILMQFLWKSKIGWNQVIPEECNKKWLSWLSEVDNLKNLRIPRCHKSNITNPEDTQLHIFCDASADSYCAVAYLRLKKASIIEISLVYSKSRVAPISNKSLTIPKLELTGAVLGVRIANLIKENIQVDNIYYWTDSMVVLAWLSSKKYLKIFEKNRVNEILNSSQLENWNWIPTKENVADIGTRENVKNLTNDSMWFKGPAFLSEDVSSWKDYFKSSEIHWTSTLDFPNVMVISENIHVRKNILLPDIQRFNKLHNLLKVTAWQLRYVKNLKAKITNQALNTKSFITLSELNEAKNLWIRKIQQECFKNDIDKYFNISNGSKSRLSRYNMSLDKQNIFRLQGRMKPNQFLEYDSVNPIILDGDHKFTKLLILDLHIIFQHFSVQSVVHEFKNKYWMPKMNSKIKSTLKLCLNCALRKPQPVNPPCGDMIPERTRFFEKTFAATGIDYFGPYYVKNTRKLSPRYGVLFTCLTTRATHIEIAHSLSSDSCLMAIQRMMWRRGQIRLLRSDNASNFKGASLELKKCVELLNPEEIGKELVKYGIQWEFIPVRTPHFGGCWERIIGCFKRALSAVLPSNRNLTDEMLQTVFAQTEYIMNTRPYTLESDNPDDPSSLTPIDILIPKFIEVDRVWDSSRCPVVQRRQWRICDSVVDSFWTRFLKEYIPNVLNNKLRKFSDEVSVNVGDLVYVKNISSRQNWPLGKIEKTFPGRDGRVRIAEVLFGGTSKKISTRNLLKITLNENLI